MDGGTGARSSPTRRTVVRALIRPFVTVAAVLVLYYLLPLDRGFGWATVGWLLGGLAAIGLLAAWQVRSVLRSPLPTLRALETLAFTVPVFLVLFASVYVLLDTGRPGQFTEPLSRTDALYFVVVVFSTVGFGDIAPVSETARVLTMLQIVSDLLLLGVVLRAMVVAVQHSRGRLAGRSGPAGPQDEAARDP
ncbi:MAG TPA: potassium channel family protein [Blastococcus sp.]|nr:potassium channel family protein [Blastococcus sp.]